MKGKIINFSRWNPKNQRTGIEIDVEGNGLVWFSHFGTTDTLKPFKKLEVVEFTADKDRITSLKKIEYEPKPELKAVAEAIDEVCSTKQKPVLTPKAQTETIFANETAIIQSSHNIVNHFITKNEGTKTLKKELFLKVYGQLKLDERTRLINELRKG